MQTSSDADAKWNYANIMSHMIKRGQNNILKRASSIWKYISATMKQKCPLKEKYEDSIFVLKCFGSLLS